MNYFRVGIQLLKWLPVVSTLAIIVSFAFLLNGIEIVKLISHPLACPMLPCTVLFVFSKMFKFCLWHRILIGNLFLVATITYINVNFRPFTDSTFIWITLLISSVSCIVSLILYIHCGTFKKALIKGN